MKIRLCPKCGKQNDENAWSCADCGATLSMNTIVDIGDLQAPQVAIAGKGLLASVSPYFQDDLTELINSIIKGNESIVKGCDICKRSILPPFKFGYLILTSDQLIYVLLKSDTQAQLIGGILPKRPYFNVEPIGGIVTGKSTGVPVYRFVDRPTYPLTSTEKSTREVTVFSLKDLYSTELVNDLNLTPKFREGDGLLNVETISFYFNNEAFEIHSLLGARLK